MSDEVILVDSHDRCVGFMEKIDAHRGDAKRHRAISVFLFNAEGKLLVQQRSNRKIVGALQWANTCCGNVLRGETRKHCAYRRLRQELGITRVKIRKIDRFEYHIRCNNQCSEWEIDDIYVGYYDGDVIPNPEEVHATQWVDPKSFMENVLSGKNTYAPWVKEIIDKTQINRLMRPHCTDKLALPIARIVIQM